MSEYTKEELVQKFLNDIRGNIYENEDFLFDCANESLSRWSKKKLEKHLNLNGDENA